jgi:hypothetical protein
MPTPRLAPTLALTALLAAAGRADTPPAEAVEFFEAKVRPVLVEHCYGCHSAEQGKSKGGLQLDTRAGVRAGGDGGPAVVPGKPDASPLVKAVRYTDPDLRMPPKGKLPAEQIAVLEAWVRMGAPDPRTGAAVPQPPGGDAARSHWAFRPVRDPPAPAVKRGDWVRTPVDAFVLANLEARGLSPSPEADRRTLIRRAYFDLTGLPPTYEEVEAFAADDSPDAFARLVDRLLASPRYGERWGRHWLDVARYADTKDGVLMYGDDRVRPFAYTYRDYVIRAFNDDLPFDRFVHEQLAADQLGPEGDPARLAAMGFLTLGRTFDNNVHDVIDDRIDVVTRGLLGMTVSCARCHDHKYDPIPTEDYYSLYGVFAASEAPLVPPPLDPAARGPEKYEKAYAAKRKEVEGMLDSQYALLSEAARSRVADYLVHVATTEPDPMETAIYFLSLAPEDLRPPIVARWRTFLARRATPDDPVFGPWHDLFALPEDRLAAGAGAVVDRWKRRPPGTAPGQLNPLVRDALAAAEIASRADVARTYGGLLKRVYDESKPAGSPPDAARGQLLDILTAPDSPPYFPKGHTSRYMSRADKDAFGGKLQELDRLAVKEPDAPPRAMALADSADLHDPRVFIRGNPARPGASVPRRFLRALAGDAREPFPNGSGRLDLARAITAPDNPLTARVIVNRVWMHHFGEPLVETPNDFGLRTPRPVQAELLDHLAAALRNDGWSLKSLHRRIMLSNTYRQASSDRPDCRRIDPENRLLWRMNRRRLDLEAMRDSMLAASGRLEHKLYGRPVDVAGDPQGRRRTVYGLVDRQSLPGLYRAFDFASPDQSAERRPHTTVPQQALFGLNSRFVLVQAESLATRPEVAGAADPQAKVTTLYRAALARDPDAGELRAATGFVAAAEEATEKPPVSPWAQLAQVLLLTNEFLFVD